MQSRIDRYAPRGPLARGGMGEIVLLWDADIGREVAGKVLHASGASEVSLRARFLDEARVQGRLEHPSIVPVYDMGETRDGRPFFTMKRVRGLTLREVLTGLREGVPGMVTRFSRRKLLNAFSHVCLTIAFAHEHGVVHRDLKPSNIMVGDFGETYVLDWGLAKVIADVEGSPIEANLLDHPKTELGLIVGTPGYMSPEQVAANASEVGPETDVYALGALLFELLTYEPLHPVSDPSSNPVQATLRGADARASVRCPQAEVPPELEALCVKATAFSPKDRLGSARALADAIERFLDGDRDLTLRAEMASRLATDAEKALLQAKKAEPTQEIEHRQRAMRDVGRALALDPKNQSAGHTLSRLLLDPPKHMPEEAVAELDANNENLQRHSDRFASLAFLACLSCLPGFLSMGLRSSGFIVASCVVFFLMAGVFRFSARDRKPKPWLVWLRVGFVIASTGLSCKILGPLFIMPLLLMGLSVGIAMRSEKRFRDVAMVGCVLMLLGANLFEGFGLGHPSYVSMEGLFCIRPDALELRPGPTLFWLSMAQAGLVWIVGRYVSNIRAELTLAQERFQLYVWHLRQLVPTHIV